MAVNVNKGPAAQDFKIEIIVISASMHKVFKEFSQGFSIVRILFLHIFISLLNVCNPKYEPRCSRFQGSYD